MMIEKFNRREQKYVLTNEKYSLLLEKIKEFIVKDKYFKEIICNVYFDTENNDLIIKSIQKPIYKEKVRLRSYGVPNDDSEVFLEIKKKFNGLVNKRRVSITYKQAKDYIENDINPLPNSQIMKEIDYIFKRGKLKPKISITYDRQSYLAKDDLSVRITFDKNIKSRTDNICLDALDDGNFLLDNGYIMEVKSLNGMPFWLINALNELKIYPTSFSKYGKIYTKLKEENNYV